MVVFGLFHGLIFLPMVLSRIGPKTYEFKRQEADDKTDLVQDAKQMEVNVITTQASVKSQASSVADYGKF